jgi:hypothetical protein
MSLVDVIVSYENKLLWSDVDDYLTSNILEFFYRCDNTIKLGSTNRRLRLATEEFSKSVFYENRCDYPIFDSHTKEKILLALKEKEEKNQKRYGLTLINGQTVNLESFVTVLDLSMANLRKSKEKTYLQINEPIDETEMLSSKHLETLFLSLFLPV